MTEYQLAKLVEMSGRLKTRKRLQKATYLLQAAGCPLDTDFILHLYGPYSHEVAYMVDMLTAQGVLREEETGNPAGREYTYELQAAGRSALEAYEQSPEGGRAREEMEKHRGVLDKLLKADLRELELAATMVLFKGSRARWRDAVSRTAAFKNVKPTDPILASSRKLAQSVLPRETR
jgi:uncharacterized protein YwgA